MTLLEFYNDYLNSNRLVDNQEEALAIEQKVVSEFSCCKVDDKETLARMIFSPIHIDENDNITPAAYQDLSRRGLSVNRIDYISKEETIKLGEKRAKQKTDAGKNRELYALTLASTSEIRKSIDNENNKRMFAVYDTATQDDKFHADVCLINKGIPKNFYRRVVQKLFKKEYLKECKQKA